MESFRPIHLNAHTITNSKQNNIIKVRLNDIAEFLKKYDDNKGIWRRWVSDHAGIIALRSAFSKKAGEKNRLLSSDELYELLLILIKYETKQNTASGDIFVGLYDKVGCDLVALARLVHTYNPALFTSHIINLLTERKDNIDASSVKKVMDLIIQAGIVLEKDLICDICKYGHYVHQFELVTGNLKAHNHCTNIELIKFVILNAAQTPMLLNWCLLPVKLQNYKNLKNLVIFNLYTRDLEKGLIDNALLMQWKIDKFEILFSELKFNLYQQPSLISLWMRAERVREGLNKLKTSDSFSSFELTLIESEQLKSSSSTSSLSPSFVSPKFNKEEFAAKLQSTLFLFPPRVQTNVLPESSILNQDNAHHETVTLKK